MPRRTFDPTKVRAFPPELPAKQLQPVWDAVALEVLNENPGLTTGQLVSIAIRRFQERLTHRA
jgi:hypothetical protein